MPFLQNTGAERAATVRASILQRVNRPAEIVNCQRVTLDRHRASLAVWKAPDPHQKNEVTHRFFWVERPRMVERRGGG